MKTVIKKLTINLISILLVLAIFYFLGREFVHDWGKIKSYSFNFNFGLLTLSIVLYAITFFFLSLGLYLILKYFHKKIPFYENWLYFCITQPAKYIPGKIWMAVARMKFFKPHEIPNPITFLATGTESVLEIFAGAYISLVAILQTDLLGNSSFWGTIVVSAFGLLFLYPPVFYFFINLYLRIVRLPLIEKHQRVSFLKILLLQIIYALAMAGFGISHLVFLQSFAPVASQYFPFLISIGSFSYVASMIALFAPSGLGVREGIWFLALKTLVASPVAIIYAFASRIWTIVVEAILLFICLPLFWIKRNGARTKNMV
ncbi:flippase-like domain-containing protein [Candidatus Peregrinibacteria bacterium]|nr:flippase-like domain-containing protein [Candidatus Peregrinibacteria bacterium]